MNTLEKRAQAITDAENGKITGKALWEMLTKTWDEMNGIEKMGDESHAKYMVEEIYKRLQIGD